jgi:small GTP-binding protein
LKPPTIPINSLLSPATGIRNVSHPHSKKFNILIKISKSSLMGETPLIRLIVIGDSGVGKTQMMIRFTDDTFTAQGVSTVGVDFKAKTINISGVPHKVQIWDTAGQERFRNITEAYYRKGHGIAIVYDVTNRESFQNIPGWFDSVKNKCEGLGPIPIVLIGNKADMEAVIPMEEGFQLATEKGAHFFQTSALDGSNIEDAFTDLATEAASSMESKRAGDKPATGVELGKKSDGSQPKKKGFC